MLTGQASQPVHGADPVLRVIHGSGVFLVGVCLLAFVWLSMLRHDRTSAQIKELTNSIAKAQRDATMLEAAQDRQRAILMTRQEALAQTGQLPTQAPIEEYFRMLSDLSSRHQLRVIRNQPLTRREYPGLTEQRYTYEVTGSLPDIMRFLKSIEEADFWADVSYLKIERGLGTEESAVHNRVAVLTLSLFSAPSPKPDGDTAPLQGDTEHS